MRFFVWLSILVLLAGAGGCNRNKPKPSVTPPAAALQTLRALFPTANADSARWEFSKKGVYEAHFRLNGLHHKLRTDSVGRHRETEINVARRALPAAVQDTLQAHYDRHHDPKIYRVRAVSIVQFADGHTEYEAQVRVAGKWRKRYYDDQGRLLREEKAKKG